MRLTTSPVKEETPMDHIKRDGQRWLVFKGWFLLASFPTKQEANEYIELLKADAKAVAL
jgi:hypothetical protein